MTFKFHKSGISQLWKTPSYPSRVLAAMAALAIHYVAQPSHTYLIFLISSVAIQEPKDLSVEPS